MAGALISTIQIEMDVEQLATAVHVICLTAGFGLNISLAASLPECE